MDKPWRNKAHREIATLCFASWKQANRGKRKHMPYSVPADAEFLIDCLNRDDEISAKDLFLRRAMYRMTDKSLN